MPIIFEELEKIMINWKKHLKTNPIKDRATQFSYNKMKELVNENNTKKIISLFKSINIDDVQIYETINTDRTYGKNVKQKNVNFNKKASL
tara:strand:- start:947 stop:1216 length:270 start_codon:yes stop_codon:yes gene_type:complete